VDITGKIAQANGRLKANRVRVSIQQIGDKLYLQATLPPKPDSSKTVPYQQRIALGVGAHPRGVSLAEKEARKVGSLLDCKEFDWTPYLTAKGLPPQTIGDWVARFEAEFKSSVEAVTWKTDYQRVFDSLNSQADLTEAVLRQAIERTAPNTRSRRRWCLTLSKLAKFAGLECDFKPLQGKYSATQVDPRYLPTDEHIAEWFYKITNPGWRWIYGIIATYGLRNHEAFFLDTTELEQGGCLIMVTEGKTDHRLVWPCYPEWIEQFGLRTKHLPPVTGADHAAYGQRVTHYFANVLKLPFTALDLRHRWAIRTLEFGLPVELAAKQMGHSVKVHCETYHRWITADVHQRAFEALMLRTDRPKPPSVANHQSPSEPDRCDSDRLGGPPVG
jgi:integrase